MSMDIKPINIENKKVGFFFTFRYSDIIIADDEEDAKEKIQNYIQNGMRYGEFIDSLTLIELDSNGDPVNKEMNPSHSSCINKLTKEDFE